MDEGQCRMVMPGLAARMQKLLAQPQVDQDQKERAISTQNDEVHICDIECCTWLVLWRHLLLLQRADRNCKEHGP